MSTVPASLNTVYILLLLACAAALVFVFRKQVIHSTSKNKYLPFFILIVIWAAFSIMAVKGVFLDTIKNTPPAFMPAVLVILLLAAYFALYYKPLQELKKEKTKYVVAIQTFRLPLELIFVWLLSLDLLPIQMTIEGRNPDMLIGITAPLIAYFGYHKKLLPKWVLIGWNIAGLILLFNIVTIAILSAPTNFQVFTNLPHNTMVLMFPYTFIPLFLVPLALFGHLFALKRLLNRNTT